MKVLPMRVKRGKPDIRVVVNDDKSIGIVARDIIKYFGVEDPSLMPDVPAGCKSTKIVPTGKRGNQSAVVVDLTGAVIYISKLKTNEETADEATSFLSWMNDEAIPSVRMGENLTNFDPQSGEVKQHASPAQEEKPRMVAPPIPLASKISMIIGAYVMRNGGDPYQVRIWLYNLFSDIYGEGKRVHIEAGKLEMRVIDYVDRIGKSDELLAVAETHFMRGRLFIHQITPSKG